jgi:hypothetical protein
MVKPKIQDFMSQIEHYRAVLDDLQRQRDLYQLKITEVDQAIASLHRLIPDDAKKELPVPDYSSVPKNPIVQAGKYAGMGVRWAILSLLSETATGPMSTGEIAIALQDGGITSTAAKFAGNVSAVLSVMSKQRGEVTSSEHGWAISIIGRQAWAHIRTKRELQSQQLAISSNVQ